MIFIHSFSKNKIYILKEINVKIIIIDYQLKIEVDTFSMEKDRRLINCKKAIKL